MSLQSAQTYALKAAPSLDSKTLASPNSNLDQAILSTKPEVFEDRINQTRLLRFRSKPTGSRTLKIKRAFDIVASLMALLSLLPLLALIWILVRLTSKGPGLFWTTRIGLLGKPFSMPKFRSMWVNAPIMQRENLPNPNQLVTPFGNFLRKSSLDELPQLWSILVGDMSLIGPRPLLPNDQATHFRLRQARMIYTVRPGVTGLAQISGRNLVSPRAKMKYDSFYAENMSLKMDAYIFFNTFKVLLETKSIL